MQQTYLTSTMFSLKGSKLGNFQWPKEIRNPKPSNGMKTNHPTFKKKTPKRPAMVCNFQSFLTCPKNENSIDSLNQRLYQELCC